MIGDHWSIAFRAEITERWRRTLSRCSQKGFSPEFEWRFWQTTGSQSRQSFTPGPTSVSPLNTRGESPMGINVHVRIRAGAPANARPYRNWGLLQPCQLPSAISRSRASLIPALIASP
jgi:hypothetical protein